MSTDQTVAATTERSPRALRARRVALRVLYGLLSVWAMVMAHGVVLLLAGQAVPGWSFLFAASSVFKLITLAATVPLAWTAGRRTGAARWLAVGLATWLLAEAITGQLRPLRAVVTVLVWLGPWLLLAPERRQLFTRPARPPLLVGAAVALGVVGSVIWAVRAGRTVPSAIPSVVDGPGAVGMLQLDLAGIPLSLAAAVLLAVTATARSAVAPFIAGAACTAVGGAGLVWPHDLGSPGTGGGAALLVAGAALLTWSARRAQQPT